MATVTSSSASSSSAATATVPALKLIKQVSSFGGTLSQYSHDSHVNHCTMTFSIFLPPGIARAPINAEVTAPLSTTPSISSTTSQSSTSQSSTGPTASSTSVPVLYFLAGLTCTDEVFFIKSGAQRLAAERGIALVSCDTSPRGAGIESEDDKYDFGTGAGFYLDATEPNWSTHYNMSSYVMQELPQLIGMHFPILPGKQSIMGHSMGGHGALTLAFRHPETFRSVSAFAPICFPTECPWGIKAFTGYLGPDDTTWKLYDATRLMRDHGPFPALPILIDQGDSDQFLREKQLLPEAFEAACKEVGQALEFNLREKYDHSYFFIATFMANHMKFHCDALLT